MADATASTAIGTAYVCAPGNADTIASTQAAIVEVLGRPGHEHYQVRWDEQHESIVFPADGVRIIPGPHH